MPGSYPATTYERKPLVPRYYSSALAKQSPQQILNALRGAIAQRPKAPTSNNFRGFAGSPNAPGPDGGYIQLRPFTKAALVAIIAMVPAVGQLDPVLLKAMASPGEAMGLLGKRDRERQRAMNAAGSHSMMRRRDAGDPNDYIDMGNQSTQSSGSGGSADDSTFDPFSQGPITYDPGTDPTTVDPGFDTGPVDNSSDSNGPGGIMGDLENSGDFVPNADQPPADQPQNAPPSSNDQPAPSPSTGMDRAVILQAQTDLATWRAAAPSASALSDYGTSVVDLSGVADQRFAQELQSYQRWANSTQGESLRTDGQLDQASYDSLSRTVAKILAGQKQSAGSSGGTSSLLVLGALGVGAYFLMK